MGKHEREAVQELEKSVCAILNDGESQLASGHIWSGHDSAMASRIADDFPDLKQATTTGNTYATAGDVDLRLRDDTIINLELKASASKAGRGTAANISQDALTTYGLVPGAESWSDFRNRTLFNERVIAILDQHPASANVLGKERKGRVVKSAAKTGDPFASDLMDEVRSIADADRKAYMAYLSGFAFDEQSIRRLTFAILTGNHRKTQVEDLVEVGIPLTATEVPGNYVVYFSNLQTNGSVSISKLDRETIVAFLSVDELTIKLGTDAKATSHIQGKLRSEEVVLLNFILHWKNVFLGIKTPCINVFLGEFIQGIVE